MKLRIASTFAAGLLVATLPTFAQTPTSPFPPVSPAPPMHGNMDKAQDHAEHKEQWKDCMSRIEAKEPKGKAGGQHMGNGKGAAANKGTGKAAPNYEPKNEGKGEPKEGKMNRHEEMMQDCRNQLYGGKHEEPGAEGKSNGVTPN